MAKWRFVNLAAAILLAEISNILGHVKMHDQSCLTILHGHDADVVNLFDQTYFWNFALDGVHLIIFARFDGQHFIKIYELPGVVDTDEDQDRDSQRSIKELGLRTPRTAQRQDHH